RGDAHVSAAPVRIRAGGPVPYFPGLEGNARMPADAVLQNLLFLYAGVVVINVLLSAALWIRDRNPLFRSLLVAWAWMVVAFVTGGALSAGTLLIITGFLPGFAVNLMFARILGSTTGVVVPLRPYLIVLAVAYALTVALALAGAGFTAVTLPTVLAIALPSLVTAARSLRSHRRLSTSAIVLLGGCVLFSLHNIDFAFLRDKPTMATLGFTIATLVVFALSVAAPAVALEQVTEQRARLSTELDVARRIQSRIIPTDAPLPGLEMTSHVRPAESVGGDYLDVYRDGERCWFLLGDVTGHGLGAGLVMLMAQSTMSSLLRQRPEISPRELNFLANQVLAANLERLQERRHLTAVSLLRTKGNRFAVSGSHDSLLIYRSASGAVETCDINHFPVGLGYAPDLAQADFTEDALQLGPGDILLMYTDGVTEAARRGDPHSGLFGTEPLVALLKRHARSPLPQLKQELLDELDRFTGNAYDDDVSFLALRAFDEQPA
ncbi:MAG: PP2C family protein-serine/threonine phosphatase, partial [bacterium]